MNFKHAICTDEGVVRNKKTYFAILAHKNEEALTAQVQNIRRFNPDAGIIVYNGGTDPDFGKGLNTLYYPNSHPIRYGNLTAYFWEIMKWLEQNHVEYKYLINLDHDVLFVKHGFQDYLDKLMKDYDVMGWDMVPSSSPSDAVISCCRQMWKEWDKWGPIFGRNSFIRYLNSTQVYRHDIVRRMLEKTDHRLIEDKIKNSKVFALEEIFFVTLAASKGARIREYPREENWKRSSRFRGQITLEEAEWVKEHPYYYWIHPVKEERLILFNKWLSGEELSSDELEKMKREKDSGMRQNPDNQLEKQTETDQKTQEADKVQSRPNKRNKKAANKQLAGKFKAKKRKLPMQPIKSLRKRKPLKAGKANAAKQRTTSSLPSFFKERRKTKLRTPVKFANKTGRQMKRSA